VAARLRPNSPPGSDAPQVDEEALAQAGEVMKLETEIKKTHLGLLIRLRNLLTETQRAQLQKIRTQ
jgi:hypothetical protein